MGVPELWLLAGLNGAGKTTSTQRQPIAGLLPGVTFLNPDDRTLAKIRATGYQGFADAPIDAQTALFFESANETSAQLEAAVVRCEQSGVETVLSSDKYRTLVENRVGPEGVRLADLCGSVVAGDRKTARGGSDSTRWAWRPRRQDRQALAAFPGLSGVVRQQRIRVLGGGQLGVDPGTATAFARLGFGRSPCIPVRRRLCRNEGGPGFAAALKHFFARERTPPDSGSIRFDARWQPRVNSSRPAPAAPCSPSCPCPAPGSSPPAAPRPNA
jgi:hypothetical protein